jgi:hypothetical protein
VEDTDDDGHLHLDRVGEDEVVLGLAPDLGGKEGRKGQGEREGETEGRKGQSKVKREEGENDEETA